MIAAAIRALVRDEYAACKARENADLAKVFGASAPFSKASKEA